MNKLCALGAIIGSTTLLALVLSSGCTKTKRGMYSVENPAR